MTISLKPGERMDDLQIKGYRIIQDSDRFCFGMDAVLLSGFARVRAGEKVLDLGTGTGILPLLLEAKTQAEHLSGLEIQDESADMARRSVAYNRLTDKIEIVTGDIKEAASIFGSASFEVVTVNPPYMASSHGLLNPGSAKAVARHEVLCTLDDVLRESARILKSKGRFYMVHRPQRLVEIFSGMTAYKIEPKRMRLVHPHPGKVPNMVLIEGMRDGNPQLNVDPPLFIFDEAGKYTAKFNEIYGL